ncbi:putative serpin-Z6A [Lolium rigidum]|uniref:putative serpin-Z6A n=1 Tax=Lolium rigidum TaxID=89674 RepID=UPI001F5C1BBF|nr:putative serpin-Z6A [Lolium rigidum]
MDSTATTNPLACGGLTALSLRLLGELAETGASTNLVFSPLSIYAALALTAAGARGATLQEFLAVLGARSRDELAEIVRGFTEQVLADRPLTGGPHVSFACGLWHDETRKLKPAFRDAAAHSYKAETRAVDFREKPGEAVKLINAWVAAATNNLIDSILTDGQVSNETDIIVANAVYFKGMWAGPFNKEYTEDDKFHRLDGSTFDVPFMQSGAKQYIACHQGFKVLRLQYKDGHQRCSPPSPFSMCIFLPDARDGLSGLISRIVASSSSDFIREHLPTSLVTVGEFRLPRFKLTFSSDMSSVLQRLGLQVAFDLKEADLCDMVEDEGTGMPLALQSIIHKAVIEVNEYGTEAAAATASRMKGMAAPNKNAPVPVDFVADHPFVFFLIEEESGAILFAGTVLEPSPSVPGEKLLRGGSDCSVDDDVDIGPVQCQLTSENANRSLLASLRHCLRCLFG